MTVPWHFAPFDMDTSKGLTAYRFVIPHVAISGDDLPLDYDLDRHQWHVVQELDGRRWEAYGNSQLEAILALIACRWGVRATFEPDWDQEAEDDIDGGEGGPV